MINEANEVRSLLEASNILNDYFVKFDEDLGKFTIKLDVRKFHDNTDSSEFYKLTKQIRSKLHNWKVVLKITMRL